jgi:hypothetical protein
MGKNPCCSGQLSVEINSDRFMGRPVARFKVHERRVGGL